MPAPSPIPAPATPPATQAPAVTAASPQAASAAPTPAAQLASAMVSFTAEGTTRGMTVQLTPEALGRVQISLASDASGRTSVQITAERPETLAALRSDQPELSRALDQAGIPAAGRSISFQLADAPGTASSAGNGTPNQGQGGSVQTPASQTNPTQNNATGASAIVSQGATAQAPGGPATPSFTPAPQSALADPATRAPATSPDGRGSLAASPDGSSGQSGGRARNDTGPPSADVSLSGDMNEAADARPSWTNSGLDIMA